MAELITNSITGQKGWVDDDGNVYPVERPEQAAPEYGSNLDMLVGLAKESGQDAYTVAKEAFSNYKLGGEVITGATSRDSATGQYYAGQHGLEDARERSPVSTTIAQYAPEIGMAALDRGRSLARSALLGGSEGIRFQPEQGDQVRTGAISAGIATAFPMAARVFDMASGMASAFRSEAGDRAIKAGMPVSAGQVAPDSGWKLVDRLGENMPFSNLLSTPIPQQQQVFLNRAANRAIGETGDTVTRANRNAAGKRINETYKTLAQTLDKAGGIQLSDDLADNVRIYFRKLDKMNELDAFKGLREGGTGTLSGDEALSLHRMMVRQADLAANNDAIEPMLIGKGILEPLDNLIRPKLGDGGTQAWLTAREQGRFLNNLETGKAISGVNVNPSSLHTPLRRNMPAAINRGEGEQLATDAGRELVEAVDILADPAMKAGADSGTAGRLANMAGAGALLAEPTIAGATMGSNSLLQSLARSKGGSLLADMGLIGSNVGAPVAGRAGQLADTVVSGDYSEEDRDARLGVFKGTHNANQP